jgi:hypothetical protein
MCVEQALGEAFMKERYDGEVKTGSRCPCLDPGGRRPAPVSVYDREAGIFSLEDYTGALERVLKHGRR